MVAHVQPLRGIVLPAKGLGFRVADDQSLQVLQLLQTKRDVAAQSENNEDTRFWDDLDVPAP